EVSQSDIFIGIIGMRYGSVEETMGRSFVELEYSKAQECKLPTLVYLMDENNATIHPKDMDCENGYLLKLFKQRLKTNHKFETFISEVDLSNRVLLDVGRTLREKGLISESKSRGKLVASINSGLICQGDRVHIEGKTTEKVKSIGFWLFHSNYFLHRYVYVYPDGSFSDTLSTDVPKLLPEGQYFVLLQRPSSDNSFNVLPVHEADTIKVISTVDNTAFNLTGEGSLKGSDAANAVLDMLSNKAIDDLNVRLTFSLEKPWIFIDRLFDIQQGDIIPVTGTTNLSVDNGLIAQIEPLSDKPLEEFEENSTGITYIKIIAGKPHNHWYFELDTSTMREGKYRLLVLTTVRPGRPAIATMDFSVKKRV
ncbi:MAG: DUF4062 domain-containing protein, partial [Candidatus Methanomethylophilaceae archaeon]